MPTMTTKKKPDANVLLTKLFADMFQSYLECSDAVQEAIREMVSVMQSPDVTEEESEAALMTIADALFPCKHNGGPGNFWDDQPL